MGEDKSNGHVRWPQLWTVIIGLCTLILGVTGIITSNLYCSINKAEAKAAEVDKAREAGEKEITQLINVRLTPIEVRLGKIMDRLGIPE